MTGEADCARTPMREAGESRGGSDGGGVAPAPPTVAAFFGGKSVLVTGATGFLGKVLVEKLIRSCPDIDRIYLLIRTKRGQDAEQRLQDFIKGQVFDQVRKLGLTERLSRLSAVSGDVSEDDLGMSESVRRNLAAKVNVVFHCAANVRFDLTLRDAVSFNTIGTKRVLGFASTISNLQAFIHVSTAYCHCQEEVLEEKRYPPHADPQRVMDSLHWMDDEMLRDITPKLIHPLPNTYAFSKSLSEALVGDFGTKHPVGIARPSIVMPSWQEPFPGWVDNLNGPSGLLVGAAKGVIRSIHCKGDYLADLVPVDLVVNSVIALAWKVGTTKPESAIVINVTESGDNPMTWGDVLEISKKYARVTPSEGAVWYPDGSMKNSWWQHILCVIFFHFIPAYIIDFLLFLTGHRTFMVRLQHRIQGGLAILYYYTTKNWIFENAKMKQLNKELCPADQQAFPMDIKTLDWHEYFKNYVYGLRHYVLHEDPDTTKAVRHHQRLYVLHRTVVTLFYALVAWMLYHLLLWAANLSPVALPIRSSMVAAHP